MKILLTAVILLCSTLATAQLNFTAIDTTASAVCKAGLEEEYKTKFKIFNKGVAAATSAQKTILKDIYNGAQESFLERINNNDFICDNELNPYLQGLMAEILTKNGINVKEYRMLLSREGDMNAYNTGDGTIVVHYGLLNAVETEDELVFVICHEIGHQFLEHRKEWVESIAKVSTSEEVIKKTREIKKQKYGKGTQASEFLKGIMYQKYSMRRQEEIEADSIGLVFYKNTQRSPQATITLLEKLDASDKEKDTLTVADYRFMFEKNGLKLKERYFEEDETLFNQYDKTQRIDVDSLKTHPGCATRITLIKGYLNNQFNGTAKTSATFQKIKANCAYQNLINLYNAEAYGLALYEALKLYRHDPENMLLKNIIYVNLVKIKDSRVSYTINRYVPSHDKLTNTASENRFISFVNNIKLSDLDIIINTFKS
ncbi:MAG: M48 family metallopeptidase [Bacteroidota bacterium]